MQFWGHLVVEFGCEIQPKMQSCPNKWPQGRNAGISTLESLGLIWPITHPHREQGTCVSTSSSGSVDVAEIVNAACGLPSGPNGPGLLALSIRMVGSTGLRGFFDSALDE